MQIEQRTPRTTAPATDFCFRTRLNDWYAPERMAQAFRPADKKLAGAYRESRIMKHNIMKSGAISLATALLLVASGAQADFSAGVSAASAPVAVDEAETMGGSATGWRAHVSYMFNKNFGIEGGISKYGSPDDKTIPSNMHVDTEAYDIYAVAYYPMGNDKGGVFAKVGYVAWNTETEVNDTNETHNKSNDLGLGIGGQYDITERFALRAELEWFDSAFSGDLKYSLGGVVRF